MGDNPEYFRQMSIGMAKLGFKGIDINMGCPVPNVASRGKGSGLILRPELAAELIQAAKISGLPVSVKTRFGYKEVQEWEKWLTHILKQDIANLTIHLRTRKEMSEVDAHWELIPEIKKLRDRIAPNTYSLLTINGDIPDRRTGLKLAEQYGIDGVMIWAGYFFKILLLLKKSQKSIAVKNTLICLLLGFSTSIKSGVVMNKKSKVLLYVSLVFLLSLMSLAYLAISVFFL